MKGSRQRKKSVRYIGIGQEFEFYFVGSGGIIEKNPLGAHYINQGCQTANTNNLIQRKHNRSFLKGINREEQVFKSVGSSPSRDCSGTQADSRPCHLQNMASKMLFHCHYPSQESREKQWRKQLWQILLSCRPRTCVHHFIHIMLEDLGLMATPIYKKVCKMDCD